MVGAFRIERLIAAGSTGAVYEATQVSLRRTVALRLIEAGHFATPEQLVRFDHRQRLAASLHHRNLVPYYEVGEWEGGRYIATRFIRGRTLAALRGKRYPPTAESLEPLGDALQAAHRAGLVHGRISDENVLVDADGTPYLADLGLDRGGSPEEDEQALAAITSRLPARGAPTRGRIATVPLLLGLVALAIPVAAVLALALDGGATPSASLGAPASPPRATALGSRLDAGAVESLGCREAPSPNTPACTLAQTSLNGSSLTVRRAGVIRGWAVRGASGDLSLQVIRERGNKGLVVGFSQPERFADPGPRAFSAEIAVRAGDRIGVGLGPGATVGARPGVPGAAIVRWDGGLTAGPQAADATTPEVELMLRADIEAGARPEGARMLVGARAASAPPGRPLADAPVALPAGRAARAVVVAVQGRIAIDVVAGRRLARLAVPDADPAGELLWLAQSCGPVGVRGFCLRWRNPGAEFPLDHEFRVLGSGRIKLIG